MAFSCIFIACDQQDPPPPQATVPPARPARFARSSPEISVPRDSTLPIYDLKVSENEWASLERNAFSNETVPLTFIVDGKTYEGARIRHRGAWARGWPKKPLKIFFEKDNRFDGERCINLNTGWRDPAFVRESLAYHIYSACGAVASKTKIVRLDVNGNFHGLYIQVEQPDKPLLKRNKLEGAALYKANSHRNQADERDFPNGSIFTTHYEKQTRKSEDYADLQKFCRDLANAGNVLEFFNKNVDIDRYINYLAATALTQNWDGYNKNHFLVHDIEGSGKWFPLPWDLDRTLGDHWNQSFSEAHLPLLMGTQQQPGITGWNRLQDRFFSEPTLTARFLDRLQELLQQEFTKEKLFPVLDQLEARVRPLESVEVRRWPRYQSNFHEGTEEVKSFIEERRAFLLAEVSRLRSEMRLN